MKNLMRKQYDNNKTLAFLFLTALALCVLTVYAGPIAFPFGAAFLAAFFVLTVGRKSGFLLLTLISVAPVVLGIAFGGVSAFFGIAVAVVGLLVGLLYLLGRSKPECVSITLIAFIVMTAVALWIYAAMAKGSADFASVSEYFRDAYASFRSDAIKKVSDSIALMPSQSLNGTDTDTFLSELPLYLDNLAYLSPALVAVIGFALIGFAYKIFVRLMYKYSVDGERVAAWRFTTSNTFALFYIVILIVRFFVTELNPLGIALANLYTFFNLIYAYIGFNFVTMLLSQKMKYGLAVLIVVGALLLLSSLALSVLAVFGIIFTYATNKVGGFGARPSGGSGEKRSDDESENDDEKD